MSGSKYTTPALAAAAIIGGGIYMTRSGNPGARTQTKPQSEGDDVARKREHADAKRDMVGGGAGVGNNKMTMGPEVGAGIKYTDNPQRDSPKPNTSRDNLPSGGVSGGYGGNNSNAASIEMGPSGSGGSGLFSWLFGTSKTHQSSSPSGSGGERNAGTSNDKSHKDRHAPGETLQGLAGTGGSSTREQSNPEDDPKNTKIKSNVADSPSKRGGSPFDKHRKDVTAVEPTTEYPGKE